MATSEQPRFTVATVSGFSILQDPERGNGGSTEGITAHVLDRWHCHRVVRTYRSEAVNRRPPRTKGHDRTRALAEAEADRLNRQQRRASECERARET